MNSVKDENSGAIKRRVILRTSHNDYNELSRDRVSLTERLGAPDIWG